MADMLEKTAAAIREEIVRQYRDDDRAKWPGGSHDYEEHQAPSLIARAALLAALDPEDEVLVRAGSVQLKKALDDMKGEYISKEHVTEVIMRHAIETLRAMAQGERS